MPSACTKKNAKRTEAATSEGAQARWTVVWQTRATRWLRPAGRGGGCPHPPPWRKGRSRQRPAGSRRSSCEPSWPADTSRYLGASQLAIRRSSPVPLESSPIGRPQPFRRARAASRPKSRGAPIAGPSSNPSAPRKADVLLSGVAPWSPHPEAEPDRTHLRGVSLHPPRKSPTNHL